MSESRLEASRRDALCSQAHAWLEVGLEADGDVVVTRERCVHCGEERTTEVPRGLSAQDRAGIRQELEIRAGQVEHVADRYAAADVGRSWHAYAQRIRQLIALLEERGHA